MNQQTHTKSVAGAAPGIMQARADRTSAAIVRKGLTLQQIHGTKYAADFLKEKQIDIEIIMRVLLTTTVQRRHDDPHPKASDDSTCGATDAAQVPHL